MTQKKEEQNETMTNEADSEKDFAKKKKKN